MHHNFSCWRFVRNRGINDYHRASEWLSGTEMCEISLMFSEMKTYWQICFRIGFANNYKRWWPWFVFVDNRYHQPIEWDAMFLIQRRIVEYNWIQLIYWSNSVLYFSFTGLRWGAKLFMCVCYLRVWFDVFTSFKVKFRYGECGVSTTICEFGSS